MWANVTYLVPIKILVGQIFTIRRRLWKDQSLCDISGKFRLVWGLVTETKSPLILTECGLFPLTSTQPNKTQDGTPFFLSPSGALFSFTALTAAAHGCKLHYSSLRCYIVVVVVQPSATRGSRVQAAAEQRSINTEEDAIRHLGSSV